jgi:ubiquitin-protein ligase
MLPLEFVFKRLENEEKEIGDIVIRYSKEDFTNGKKIGIATVLGYEIIAPVRVYNVEFKAEGLMLPYKSTTPIPFSNHAASIYILRNYPFPDDSSKLGAPVRIEWISPIFHPNIAPGRKYGGTGVVCWQALKKWMKTFNLRGLILGLRILVENPNPDDPLKFPPVCLQAAEYFKKVKTS